LTELGEIYYCSDYRKDSLKKLAGSNSLYFLQVEMHLEYGLLLSRRGFSSLKLICINFIRRYIDKYKNNLSLLPEDLGV